MTGQTPLSIAEWKLKKETAYYPLNKGYDLFASHLAAKSERVPTGIQHLQEQYDIKDIVQDYAFLEGSQPYLLETQPAFGKYLAPYLVWAATNEQFSNATLKGVRYYKERQLKIDLVKDGIPFPDKVVELLAKKTTTPKEQLRLLKQNLASQLAGAMNLEAKKVQGMSLYEAFFNLRACFEYTVHHKIGSSDDPEGDDEVVYRNVFFLDGKRQTYSQFLKSMPVLRAILNLAECIRTGTYTDLTAEEYIRRFLKNELPKATLRQIRSTSLFRTYRELKLDRDTYVWHVQANTRQDTYDTSRMLFHPDIHKSRIFVKNARRMFETLKKLRESDFILNEVFDYAQTLPDTYPTDEEEQVKAAEKVGKRFKELFLVVKGRVHRSKTFLYHVTHYIEGDERVLFLPPEPIDYDSVYLSLDQATEEDLKDSQEP
eukprot:gnl/Spiro4/14462_TR7795_c0_g1_i1.p1 gnl/Spiro4/14462_TR7795_c0_g1~~gnl/Spiro4/14462_TR7795_c0_g1_i1.p1  ORF type:complete len:429 (+),score=-7.18 gnl/Spiro4/14462_TR7795_c0_g1_i1:631-1917(+)